jgi:hypothetical protein
MKVKSQRCCSTLNRLSLTITFASTQQCMHACTKILAHAPHARAYAHLVRTQLVRAHAHTHVHVQPRSIGKHLLGLPSDCPISGVAYKLIDMSDTEIEEMFVICSFLLFLTRECGIPHVLSLVCLLLSAICFETMFFLSNILSRTQTFYVSPVVELAQHIAWGGRNLFFCPTTLLAHTSSYVTRQHTSLDNIHHTATYVTQQRTSRQHHVSLLISPKPCLALVLEHRIGIGWTLLWVQEMPQGLLKTPRSNRSRC